MYSYGSRRTLRDSRILLQDLLYRTVHGGDGDTPIPAQARDAKMIPSISSLIGAKSKLLLLEKPDTVQIYKLDESAAGSRSPRKGQVYLPAITAKARSLNAARGALSRSCCHLYDERRGSLASLASQRAGGRSRKQSHLRAKGEARKSNVAVTMTYLGRGYRGSGSEFTHDELKVLQQVNGGENLCVFKGLVPPGGQFQFVSQRHRGHPFSITLHINGMVASRMSSCCEYRYGPGFRQGRRGCFRLMWLAGGTPCYRCTSLRNKHGSCQQLNDGTKENLILPLEQSAGDGTSESCPSSPLFIPAKPKKTSARRTGKHIREGGEASTDGEIPIVNGSTESSRQKRRRGRVNQTESKGKMAVNHRGEEKHGGGSSDRPTVAETSDEQTRHVQKLLKTSNNVAAVQAEEKKTQQILNALQDEEVLTKTYGVKQKDLQSSGKRRNGERRKDSCEECVETRAVLSRGTKENIRERSRLQEKPSSRCDDQGSDDQGPDDQGSDLVLGEDGDISTQPDGKPEEQEHTACQSPGKDEQDLQAQLDAMMSVLSSSDEVEQLVLRNTGLTDDLLLSLARVLKSSPSNVTLLNLNLNLVGPYGAHILLDVLRAKPQVKGLHLFGNRLRDHGVLALLTGAAELQERTRARAAASILQDAALQMPTGGSSFRAFALLELDVGGNGLSSEGVKALASFMRSHSHLRYLGLAQTSDADLEAWKELFDSLKGNGSLIQIVLDENNLGDPGVRLLADVLRGNTRLLQVDLDGNGIGDVGGNDIMGALLCRTQAPLTYLSLQENNISAGLMSRIREQVKLE